jgi:uncharacterized membrane protein YheB (UPF0754 family)
VLEALSTNLHYALFPIVGFAIGIVTNGLAITMLFHPYKEKRLFGIRIPFTPGAIPREHKRLAHKIAETICDHLLTSEEILKGFEKEEVRECLLRSVGLGVDSILNSDIKSIRKMVPDDWRHDFSHMIEQLVKRLSEEVNSILDSSDAADIIRLFVDQEINRLLAFRFDSLIDKDHIKRLEEVIKGVVTKVYHSIGLKEKAFSIINSNLDELIFSSKKVKDALSDNMLEIIEKNVIKTTEDITEALFLKMKKENALKAVEDEVKSKAKGHIINLRFIPRIIADMPITHQKIDAFLDQFITDVRGEDKLNKVDKIVIKKLKLVMQEKVRSIYEKEIKEVILEVPSDTISQVKLEIEQKLYEIFTDKDLESLLIGELDEGILNFEELEMQKLIPELTEHELNKVKDFVSETIIAGMRKREIKDELQKKMADILDSYLDKEVGSLSHVISHGLVEKIKISLFEKSFSTIKEQTLPLLETLDIKMMVEKKVEEFPLDELERIVIQIAGNQLKNITFFGGVLGFIIGLVQVLISI